MTIVQVHPEAQQFERRLDPYVPRVLLRHLAEAPDELVRTVEASVLLADISGFTALSERLARQGRQGAEVLTETIGSSLSTLCTVAYENGGSLLKIAGDALVLLFEHEGHAARACRAAVGMRRALRQIGQLSTGGGRVTLRMSQGVNTGIFHLALVGESHREQLVIGPAASTVVRLEKAADAGEILVGPATAAAIPRRCLGATKGPGILLSSEPPVAGDFEEPPLTYPSLELVASCLPAMVRAQVLSGIQPSEHRNVTIAFLRYEDVDPLVEREGAAAAADALHELVADVQRAAAEHQVCLLESDVGDGGVVLMLTAGAPRIIGDDEERMLLTLRQVLDRGPRLGVRIGVNRGNVFAGDIGPFYRRTYSVMGDAVNLAARVAAKAPPGELYATAAVLERSPTRFATTELEPFKAKGKAKPVPAWSVGHPVAGRARQAVAVRLPLVGREQELATLTGALDEARAGRGRLVDIVGEPGIGKTRLLDELTERADAERVLAETGEAFTASTPYVTWRALLREVIGAGWEDTDDVVLERLRACLRDRAPELEPWLPLLALTLDVDPPATPEVDALAPEFRRAKLHESVIAFLRAMLDEPTLLRIDDAQFVDEASGDLLAAIARELDTLPWLVLVARREDARFAPPTGENVTRLEPAALAPADTLALAEGATDAAPLNPHLLALAAERSGGNPQFLRDLLRAAADGASDELPESLEAAAMARIDRLDPEDRTLVRHASVLGLSFHRRFLADVLGDEVPAPTEATWERLEPFFATEAGGYLRFRRMIVRDAAYAGLAYRTRRRLHAAAGQSMEQEYAAMLDEVGGLLSLHFHLAGEHAKAWRYARVAAARARDSFAYAGAADLYRRALDAARGLDVPASDLAEVWEQLGEVRTRTGEVAAATEAFTRARRLVAGDPVRAARLMHGQAILDERVGRTAAAVRWARRGLRTLEGVDGPDAAAEHARLVTTLGAVRRQQGRPAEAAGLCRQAIAEAEATGDEATVARACFILDGTFAAAGRAGEAPHAQRALEIYTRLGDLERQAAVLNLLGMVAYWDGRWDDAMALYARAAEASAGAGDLWAAAYGDCNIGEVLADRGRYEEAEERLRRARRTWRGSEDAAGVAFTSALLGRLAVRAGQHDRGAKLLEEAVRGFRALRAADDAALAEAYLAEAAVFAGRARDALAACERAKEEAEHTAAAIVLLRVRGCALAQLGDPEPARESLEAALARARAQHERYEIALALDALVALGGGERDAAARERDALLRALGVERLPAPPLGRPTT